MQYRVHLTMRSRNAKTGPMPVSTMTKDACPDDCPFKEKACYSKHGPLGMHWDKVTRGELGTDWETFCEQIADLPKGTLWRYGQAGDLPGDGVNIDGNALSMLVSASTGLEVIAFSHYDVLGNDHNRIQIALANAYGFTVNLSGNNLHHADKLVETGAGPVVAVVPQDCPDKGMTPGGNAFLVCPAQTGQAPNCLKCKLCSRAGRRVVIAFRAHGNASRAAQVIAEGDAV